MELILNTYGTSLSRDNEGFVILHKDGKQRIPAQGINAILISKGDTNNKRCRYIGYRNEIEILLWIKRATQ